MFTVRLVNDDQLPADTGWAAVLSPEHTKPIVFVKRSRCDSMCGGCPIQPMLRAQFSSRTSPTAESA